MYKYRPTDQPYTYYVGMKFVGGLLVSLLFAMGLSACTSSNNEVSGERTPSREAVEDITEAQPEAAAEDITEAETEIAADDVSEAESEPAAAARANDKEAECRDPFVLDFDAEDKAGNRGEQVVFALILNESTDNDGEDGGSVKCKVSLDEIDWTSITAVEDFFTAIVEEMPQRVITENVSNVVKIDPVIKKDNEYGYYDDEGELVQYFDHTYWIRGPLGPQRHLRCIEPVDTGPTGTNPADNCGDFFNDNDPSLPHQTLYKKAEWGKGLREAILQPNAALLPSHDSQDFYQDQHLMTFGVCDAVDEEATVFFFDPNFIDEKYEYHKVWSEGSTMTQRSLPAPRFRFPYKAEDVVQQPQLIGIKIVDAATKQAVGAALIEVVVNQVKTTAGKPTIEGGRATDDLYGCKFNLKITRTYEKQSLPQRWFKSEILKKKTPTANTWNGAWARLSDDHGASVDLQCVFEEESDTAKVRLWFHLTKGMLSDTTIYFPAQISAATNSEAKNAEWYPDEPYNEEWHTKEFLWSYKYEDLGLSLGEWVSNSPTAPSTSFEMYHNGDYLRLINPIEEVVITVARGNGDLYSRHYYWIQSDSNWDSSNEKGECSFKVNGLKMLFIDKEKIEDWLNDDYEWYYARKYYPEPKFWTEFFNN